VLEPKRLSLLREVVGPVGSVGVLVNPAFPPAAEQLADIETAARAIGQQLVVLRASSDDELAAAFDAVAPRRIPALLGASHPYFSTRRDKPAVVAARAGVPSMSGFRDSVVPGGLMSYGVDLSDVYRQIGLYVGSVFKGAKPAELPVQQPIKFEFV